MHISQWQCDRCGRKVESFLIPTGWFSFSVLPVQERRPDARLQDLHLCDTCTRKLGVHRTNLGPVLRRLLAAEDPGHPRDDWSRAEVAGTGARVDPAQVLEQLEQHLISMLEDVNDPAFTALPPTEGEASRRAGWIMALSLVRLKLRQLRDETEQPAAANSGPSESVINPDDTIVASSSEGGGVDG